MIVTYIRSSSYGCHEMCEMSYYLTYQLGWSGPSGLAAEKGTIVHKVLEILANLKLDLQNGKKTFTDDIAGRVNVMTYDVDRLTEKCYEYYKSHSVNKWAKTGLDLKHCKKWVHIALDYEDGKYNPMNAEIVMPEQSFDFEIQEPWAMYDYEVDGEPVQGFLSLKGTIDQISKIDDNTYQILDWKTGKRINWATGEEKTQEKLNQDPQLMMYYYAIQGLYPEIENFDIVIFYNNHGLGGVGTPGAFNIKFTKDDIPMIEGVIRKKFEEIKNTETPKLKQSWRCSKFCHFGRTTFDSTTLTPIVEKRTDQVTPKGQMMTKCEQTRYALKYRTPDSVMKHMSREGFTVDYYQAPGGVDEKK